MQGRISVAICEDEPIQLDYLKKEITEYYSRKNIDTKIELFASAEELLFKYPEAMPFQCMVLDIRLKDMDGMELAKRIREKDGCVKIIFVTGDRDYVFDGYKVGAVRYLLKPIKRDELIEALEYVAVQEQKNGLAEDYACIHYNGEYVKIEKKSIIYIQVKGHYITIRTDEKDYFYKETMKGITVSLNDKRFVPANRSTLVNLQNVEQIARDGCLMANGEKIVISRGCFTDINQKFIEFYK